MMLWLSVVYIWTILCSPIHISYHPKRHQFVILVVLPWQYLNPDPTRDAAVQYGCKISEKDVTLPHLNTTLYCLNFPWCCTSTNSMLGGQGSFKSHSGRLKTFCIIKPPPGCLTTSPHASPKLCQCRLQKLHYYNFIHCRMFYTIVCRITKSFCVYIFGWWGVCTKSRSLRHTFLSRVYLLNCNIKYNLYLSGIWGKSSRFPCSGGHM